MLFKEKEQDLSFWPDLGFKPFFGFGLIFSGSGLNWSAHLQLWFSDRKTKRRG